MSKDERLVNNQQALQELDWSIEMSQGQFSLILARCNYTALRSKMVQQLPKISSVEIREIILQPSDKRLYSRIKEELEDEIPLAVMVLGLDSVRDIEHLLTSMNSVREEFRKNFTFPVVLWLNDETQRKFIRLAPDFESWTTQTQFTLGADELLDFLQQSSEQLFTKILDAGAAHFLSHEVIFGSLFQELDSALRDLENYDVQLSANLEACWQFCQGRDLYARDQIDQALNLYQQSLTFWQQDGENRKSNTDKSAEKNSQSLIPGGSKHPKLREGVLLFHIGLSHYRQAELQRTENTAEKSLHWEQARSYFQQCIDVFEQAQRSDLVAKFIGQLEQVLQKLQDWDELQEVAQQSWELHQGVPEFTSFLAQDYGFFADVALHREDYGEAKKQAEMALQTLEATTEEQHQGWYLLLLARSLQHLRQTEKAIAFLEKAKAEDPQDTPQIYIEILNELSSLYFQQHRYLEAFEVKQLRRSMEQQFGFRAFIGAGRLQPQKKLKNLPNKTNNQEEKVAQEIVASGRSLDVERLIERIGKPQYKLTIIYGQSGVGKSSLVNAGLIPALEQRIIGTQDVVPLQLRIYTDWARELGKLLAQELAEQGFTLPLVPDSAATIVEQLAKNQERNLLTVLIFDQFEEFFFVCTEPSQRELFFEFLGNCLNINVGVKVILSLREDYLHYLLVANPLHSMRAIDNDILSKNVLYPIGNFSPADAKELIQRLTEYSQFPLEPDLVDEIVQELARELGEVRPIELQILGAQLQTKEITTLVDYKERGSKDKLVQQYLEEVIQDCGGDNEKSAKLILYLLTNENNTRPLKTRFELIADLKAFDENLVPNSEKLNLILEIFVKSGLVFLFPEIPANRYQLIHDYLAGLIRQTQESGLIKELEILRKQKVRDRAEIEKLLKEKEKLLKEKEKLLKEKDKNLVVIGENLQRTKKQRLLAVIATAVTTIVGVAAVYQANRAASAEIKAKNSVVSSLLLSDNQIEALVNGVQAGKQLKEVKKVPFGIPFETEIATLGTLQQVIHSIQECNRLEGHTSWVNSITFRPDGKMIASASADNTVRLWRKNGELHRTLNGHSNRVNGVSFSRDGKMIASASDDKTVKLWNLNGEELKTLQGHESSVTSVSFSPDGEMIASASDDETVKLWNLDGDKLKTLEGHEDRVKDISFSPDGKTIASASWDNTVKLWNREGRLLKTLAEKKDQFTTHTDKITTVRFSPDGNTIASASWDKTVKLWDREGNFLYKLQHEDIVTDLSFGIDGNTLASVSYDGTVKLWDLDQVNSDSDSEPEPETLDIKDVVSISFSPDNKTIALAGTDNTIRLWSLEGFKSKTLQHEASVNSVSFSPDGKMLASGSDDKTVKLWNQDEEEVKILDSHNSSVVSVRFSPDGKIIASSSEDGAIKLWNQDGKELLGIFRNKKVTSINFNHDGNMLAIAENKEDKDNNLQAAQLIGQVTLWNLDSEKFITFDAHDDEITSLSFSRDSEKIATGSKNNIINLWNLKGERLNTLRYHNSSITSISFSPDGRTVASGSLDTTIILWDLEEKKERTLKGHTSAVTSINFIYDGKILASGSADGTIKLWSVEDGSLLANLKRKNKAVVNDLSFNDKDKVIASANADKIVTLWNFDLDDLLEDSCNWLNDYLLTNPNLNSDEEKICPKQS